MTLTLIKDDLTPALALLRGQARNPRGLMAAASRAVANLFKKHLRMLDRTRPNKLGGKRTHMFNELARSVNVPVLTDSTATISISDPRASHKHTGGVINAKRYPFLSIPIEAEAHGRRPSVLAGELGGKIIYIWNKATKKGVAGLWKEKTFKVYYALVDHVNQPPDPPEGILPPEEEIKTVALDAAKAALQRQLKIKS